MQQPTARHSQVQARIAQYKENNEEHQVEQLVTATSTTTRKQKKNIFQDAVIIHYTHEKRFTTMKKDMHQIFHEAFQGFGIEAVRLIVGHRNGSNSECELIRK
ncbi:unnamed protein product [Rotaria sp. Silwood2]|nr:unnamed protein product [Rotaria sp. Silwood2]CAF2944939.1 unnamed protein product [Rotaria sp. Silwood2]CAF4041173.1 unnamed protein product [Rotaria sp. Silwood2]CAF4345461.1 unnamed protein product [Rotaria sp. Silwood2]CAF4581487.1 unnamed protein product [Rotaria sp. Silwood2]